MTVNPGTQKSTPDAQDRPEPAGGPGPRRRQFTQRAAVIVSGGAVGGLAIAGLTYLAAHNVAGAVAGGILAGAGAVKGLDTLID
jgi:hypothetical protein